MFVLRFRHVTNCFCFSGSGLTPSAVSRWPT
uniref:Uncharacterized protein n=1 Tax=Anguilla anguilla TaxID=7936 RepID=A0A0E9RXK2_ANGAN